jgi:GNAT superfamily N-acetyltransferase/DNA-binding MarR family transcriptional regulator
MDASQIAQIRWFNRAVTRRVGALDDSFLERGRPLGEARVLYEIGMDGAELGTLRVKLGLDSGYLSRILRTLEAQGMATLTKSEGDGRLRRATLTQTGLAERAAYDVLNDGMAASFLEPLSAEARKRLVAAMGEVELLLKASSVTFAEEPAKSADAQLCLKRYFDELAERFEEGFDLGKGNKASEEELSPPHGAFVIARIEGEPVACGALRLLDPATAEIKRMWVAPSVRGLGIAVRLLHRLEATAAQLGARRVYLDTNRALKEAHALYRREGYAEVEPFNDNPYANHWFAKTL